MEQSWAVRVLVLSTLNTVYVMTVHASQLWSAPLIVSWTARLLHLRKARICSSFLCGTLVVIGRCGDRLRLCNDCTHDGERPSDRRRILSWPTDTWNSLSAVADQLLGLGRTSSIGVWWTASGDDVRISTARYGATASTASLLVSDSATRKICIPILLCDRSNTLHYRSCSPVCPSVRLSVCLSVPYVEKPKLAWPFVLQGRSNRRANFQLEFSQKVKGQVRFRVVQRSGRKRIAKETAAFHVATGHRLFVHKWSMLVCRR